MKPYLVFIIARQSYLDVYESAVLSTISGCNKVAIINSSLKSLLSKIDIDCYDDIHYLKTKNNAAQMPCFIYQDLLECFSKLTEKTSPSNITICPTDEYNLDMVAKVGENTGITTYPVEKAILFRDKGKMKSYLKKETNIALPQHILLHTQPNYDVLEKRLKTPFVIKPLTEACSIGIAFIHNKDDWETWLKQHEQDFATYEAETFLKGCLFHIDTVRHKGKNIALAISESLYPLGETLTGKPAGSMLITETHPAYQALLTTNQNALNTFNVDGCFHLECFWDATDGAYFLEVAWRETGRPANINFQQIHNGLSQGLIYVYALMNQPIPVATFDAYQTIKFFLVRKKGLFKGLELPPLKSQVNIEFLIKPGTIVKENAKSFHDIAATFTLTNTNYEALREDFLALRELD